MTQPEPRILNSARKHQEEQRFTDADILAVFRIPMRTFDVNDDMRMLIGMALSAPKLLEVGVVLSIEGEEVIVHAMLARKKFLR